MNRSSRVAAVSCAVLSIALAVRAWAAPLSLQAQDLNGRGFELPTGLPAERTLLLVGFRHADQTALDVWRRGLELSPGDPSWLETPVIGVRSAFVRQMIVNGMRAGAASPAARAHLAPVFADPADVAGELGVDLARPAVVVLDRRGRILARASGDYAPAAARALAGALRGAD